MPRGVSKCPNCGEPVSQFAAGCAICGADIAGARAARAKRRAPLERVGGSVAVPLLGDDGLRVLIAVIVTIAAPFIGVLLACWFAWQLHEEGRFAMRNVMLALAALALFSLTHPFWFWRLVGAA